MRVVVAALTGAVTLGGCAFSKFQEDYAARFCEAADECKISCVDEQFGDECIRFDRGAAARCLQGSWRCEELEAKGTEKPEVVVLPPDACEVACVDPSEEPEPVLPLDSGTPEK